MKYDSAELARLNATESTQYKCPACHNPLVFAPLDNGIKIWCPNGFQVCPCIGANEGGFGKNEAAAFIILTQKLNFGK